MEEPLKNLFYVLITLSFAPLLFAQHLDVDDGGTEEEGGNDGASGNLFAPLELGNLPGFNYSVSLADEALTLKNTSEHPSAIVIYTQTEDWLTTSHSFRLESGQKIDFNPSGTLSPVESIRILSMQPFEVALTEVTPLLGSSTGAVLQAQEPTRSSNLTFIEDASGQRLPIGVMEDGSVHYPLFGKQIGVIENGTVLIDGTQQRYELLGELEGE